MLPVELKTSALTSRLAPARNAVPSSQPASENRSEQVVPQKKQSGASLSQKAERYGQWALIAQAQSRIAGLQSSEQALFTAYRTLLQLSRQLQHAGAAGQRDVLADQVEQLSKKLREEPVALDKDLVPVALQQGGGRVGYGLTRVDLLTPRNQSEQLQLFFSGARDGASVELPAQASPQQVLQVLRQQLKPLQIGADLNARGELQFSVPAAQRRVLEAPVLVSGEGIRVPAGNPVAIQLDPAPGRLDELAAGIRSGELSGQRERIQQMMSSLEDSRRQLQQNSQAIISRLNQIRGSISAIGDELQLSEQLSNVMKQAEFSQHVSVLLAQANVSRFTTVALLSR